MMARKKVASSKSLPKTMKRTALMEGPRIWTWAAGAGESSSLDPRQEVDSLRLSAPSNPMDFGKKSDALRH
jgi:hypothetical protein